MSSAPPPPPSSPAAWPPSQPPAQPASASWWTGGRILLAIVIVIVLMSVAAVGGFMAGTMQGSFSSFGGGFEDFATDFDLDDLGDFEAGVPGSVPVDAPAAQGDRIRLGAGVSGTVGDRPVEHVLRIPTGRDVTIEVVEAQFDSVLVLLDQDGTVVASDDDGGRDTNSRLGVELDAGTYLVRVQPWTEGDGGRYTLSVD